MMNEQVYFCQGNKLMAYLYNEQKTKKPSAITNKNFK